MTVGMKFLEQDPLVSLTEYAECDGLVPRGSDCLIRKINIAGGIEKGSGNLSIDAKEILDMVAWRPCIDRIHILECEELEAMTQATKMIRVYLEDAEGNEVIIQGTAVQLSASILFTAGHLFLLGGSKAKINKIKIFSTAAVEDQNCLEATLEAFTDDLLDALDNTILARTACEIRWEPCLDLAVLRLNEKREMPKYLVLDMLAAQEKEEEHENYEKRARLDGNDLLECTLGICGFPGRAQGENVLMSLFPAGYVADLKKRTNRWKPLLRQLYLESFFNFRDKVCSYGMCIASPNEMCKYGMVTASASTAMSGSPVVDLQRPHLIQGILVGGFPKNSFNVFLSATHPGFINAYKKYVKDL